MKASDILDISCHKDSRRAKTSRVMRHAAKKRKSNPQQSRTNDMHNFWDVFSGMSGYSNDSDAGGVDIGW
jgi:hypothetical protein